jgi:acyl-CoA thioester hydrolase
MSRSLDLKQRSVVVAHKRCYRVFVRGHILAMKHNQQRLKLDTYPHRTEISLRFADIDPQWHLNNVRVGEYYQEGRVAFFRHLHETQGYQRVAGSRTLVVHQSIDYLNEVTYPGTITIGIGVSRVGSSSWSFAMGMFKDAQCAGLSTTVLVYGLKSGSAPIPPTYLALLEKHMMPADSLT